jgi:hypothetical protein
MAMLYREQVGKERVKRVANLVCAFPFVLAEHLGARVTDNYSHLVTREDLLLLNRVGNRPLGIANTLGLELRAVPDKVEGNQVLFSSRERLAMLGTLDKMVKAVGACERLVQTPVPLNYARHTSRFLSIWCLTMPLAIVGDLGFLAVPVLGLVCWGLFGIQEIGLMIEEPFRRSLRLDIVTRTIYADVQETTYMPEWAKRQRMDKAEADEAEADEGLAEARPQAAAVAEAGRQGSAPEEQLGSDETGQLGGDGGGGGGGGDGVVAGSGGGGGSQQLHQLQQQQQQSQPQSQPQPQPQPNHATLSHLAAAGMREFISTGKWGQQATRESNVSKPGGAFFDVPPT